MNKTAIITGASSGIGEQFAKLLKDDYHLLLVARNKDKLEEMAKTYLCDYLPLDLQKEEDCNKLVETLNQYDVEMFINNAGFGDFGNFNETDLNKELNMIDLNVKAVHILSKGVIKYFIEKEEGYLLNVASSAGLMPCGPYMATYYASKAYVASLTQAIHEEVKQYPNIKVSALCPGPVDTNFNNVANVSFALKGIDSKYCAEVALKDLKKNKAVIVPSLRMKLAIFFSRFLSRKHLREICANQQKKKGTI